MDKGKDEEEILINDVVAAATTSPSIYRPASAGLQSTYWDPFWATLLRHSATVGPTTTTTTTTNNNNNNNNLRARVCVCVCLIRSIRSNRCNSEELQSENSPVKWPSISWCRRGKRRQWWWRVAMTTTSARGERPPSGCPTDVRCPGGGSWQLWCDSTASATPLSNLLEINLRIRSTREKQMKIDSRPQPMCSSSLQ